MNNSHWAICSKVTYSLGLCACAILPGPQMIEGMPACWKSPASVPLALNKRSGRPRLKACDAQNMGHNRPHAVGFPIRWVIIALMRLDFLSALLTLVQVKMWWCIEVKQFKTMLNKDLNNIYLMMLQKKQIGLLNLKKVS